MVLGRQQYCLMFCSSAKFSARPLCALSVWALLPNLLQERDLQLCWQSQVTVPMTLTQGAAPGHMCAQIIGVRP